MPNFKPVRIPGCLEPEIRNTFEQIVNNLQTLSPVFGIVNVQEGDVRISIEQLTAEEGDTFVSTILGSFLAIGTLDGALQRDGTSTLVVAAGGAGQAEISVHGYLVKEDYQIPDGKRVAAVKLEDVWYVLATDDCLEEVPP